MGRKKEISRKPLSTCSIYVPKRGNKRTVGDQEQRSRTAQNLALPHRDVFRESEACYWLAIVESGADVEAAAFGPLPDASAALLVSPLSEIVNN